MGQHGEEFPAEMSRLPRLLKVSRGVGAVHSHHCHRSHTQVYSNAFFHSQQHGQEISKQPPGERLNMGVKAGSKCGIVQGALSSCSFYRFSYNSLRWFMKL